MLLLGKGGHTVYLGAATGATAYFESLGFTNPPKMNPADFYMDVIGGKFHPSTKAGAAAGAAQLPWLQRGAEYHSTMLFAVWRNKSKHLHRLSGSIGSASGSSTASGGGSFGGGGGGGGGRHAHHADTSKHQPRRIPGRHVQAWRFFVRALVQQYRDINALFVDALLHTVAGLLVAVLFSGVAGRGLHSTFVLPGFISLTLALISAIYALRTFGNEKVVFYRESHVGAGMNLSRAAYFTGKNAADMPKILVLPAYFLLVSYGSLGLRIGTAPVYALLFSLTFYATGLGYVMSSLLDPRQTQLATVVLVLVMYNFGGGAITLPDVRDMGLNWLADISFTRWASEALFVAETRLWSPVHGTELRAAAKKLGIVDPTDAAASEGTLSSACWYLLAIGAVWRVLALVLLVGVDRHLVGRRPISAQVGQLLQTCISAVGRLCAKGEEAHNGRGREEMMMRQPSTVEDRRRASAANAGNRLTDHSNNSKHSATEMQRQVSAV